MLTWGTKNPGELLVDAPARIGVVEPGALADLIIVEGDPLQDLTLLSRPEVSLKAVVRDGVIVTDRLPAKANDSPPSGPVPAVGRRCHYAVGQGWFGANPDSASRCSGTAVSSISRSGSSR